MLPMIAYPLCGYPGACRGDAWVVLSNQPQRADYPAHSSSILSVLHIGSQLLDLATSIRCLSNTLRQKSDAFLCVAPQGPDFPGGELGLPQLGAKRQAAERRQHILPISDFEENRSLIIPVGTPLSFGGQPPWDASAGEIGARLTRSTTMWLPEWLLENYPRIPRVTQ